MLPSIRVKKFYGKMRIGGVVYKIYHSNQIDPTWNGFINQKERIIVISFNCKLNSIDFKETLLHEVIHGLDPTLSEEQVTNLERGLLETVLKSEGYFELPLKYIID